MLYIGLMSGTSADGIDLALVDFSSLTPKLVANFYQPYPQAIYQKIVTLYHPEHNEIDRAFQLNIELAQLFSQAIQAFLTKLKLNPQHIKAIGNHGQTIRHRPAKTYPFTLQIGCCQTLATLTGIKVIGQFRQKDMALGGQGAPLVPAFHRTLFQHKNSDVFVVNIGGIANLTFLPAQKHSPILGYDTGPGNALIDDWIKQHQQKNYDQNGSWASSGKVNPELFALLLNDEYFSLPAPKSTGREYFNLHWLHHYLHQSRIKNLALTAEDVQATLTSLTAKTIADQVIKLSLQAKIYLCGGGIYNKFLKNQLKQYLSQKHTKYEILLTNQKGIDADSLEAMAFAWLAFAYDKKFLSNIPAVTGACKETTLGCAFYP